MGILLNWMYLYEKDINVGDRVYIDKSAENVITKC